MMAPANDQRRTALQSNSLEVRHEDHSVLILRQRYKWRTLTSTAVINMILAGVLPSLGILLYYDLKDKQVSMMAAMRTPIYFIVSWCIADSWSQTIYITPSFKKCAVAVSIVTALSIGVNFKFHDTLESISSIYLLGLMAGGGVRLLMTISENIFSEYFSTKSIWASVFSCFIINSLGLILVPLLVAYFAETEGIHYAILMLGAMTLQTLPAVILLKKPIQVHSSKKVYLTNQPAYALLHNEIEDSDEQPEEVETSLSQPNSQESSTVQQADEGINMSNIINESTGVNNDIVDNIAVPLFTDVELVAGTYQGEVAYSFEDTMMRESTSYDNSELFFRGLARRRTKDHSHKIRCKFCIVPSRELHPLKQPALYLGIISMLSQKAITLMIWILLPALVGSFPQIIFHGNVIEVPTKVGAAFISMVTGFASIPVILIPFTFNSFSYMGRQFTHGVCTIITAIFLYGIGRQLPQLHISILTFFGVFNAISAGSLEALLKDVLLVNDHFKGHRTQKEEWGNIRGLANTLVGLTILLTTMVIDFLIEDWNTMDWSLLFNVIAALQLFTGTMWMITPSLRCYYS